MSKTNNKGITLIALIITIVILLILAGIAISALSGENGLFSRAKQAKEKTIESQLKEEITMAIQEIQTEELPKGNDVTLETLVEGQLEEKLEDITVELVNDEINGEYKNYQYTITDTFDIKIDGFLEGSKPNVIHSVDTEEIGAKKVVITINADVENDKIVEIIKPDGTSEKDTNTVQYTVDKRGKYRFVIKAKNGRKTIHIVNITNILPNKPEIRATSNYPILKNNGVKREVKVTINYNTDDGLINTYSEDDGKTWKEYNGEFNTTTSKILAKSQDKENDIEVSETFDIVEPKDAILKEAYDGNQETFMIIHAGVNNCIPATVNYKYMLVDSETWNHNMEIKWYCWNYSGYIAYVDFLGANNEVLKKISIDEGKTKKDKVLVPEGTVKLRYSMSLSDVGWETNSKIYEIKMVD